MGVSKRLVCTCLLSMGLLAPGCGDDSSPGGSGSSTGEGSSSTDPGSTTSAPTTSTDPSTSSSTGAEESSTETGAADTTGSLPESVSLGGVVHDFIGTTGIEGLTVGLDILDDGMVTTDAAGMFTFEGLEPDTPVNLIFEPRPDGTPAYAGGIVPERAGTMDRDDVDASVVQQPFIESQLEGLAPQDPEPADLDQAIIVARVNNAALAGGGSVTLTVDPEPAPGTYYAPSETGAAVLNSTEIAFGTLPAAVFFNVADTEAGDITITAEHSTGLLTCEVMHPHWITRGGYITQVSVVCE